jgi:hypothetical protein
LGLNQKSDEAKELSQNVQNIMAPRAIAEPIKLQDGRYVTESDGSVRKGYIGHNGTYFDQEFHNKQAMLITDELKLHQQKAQTSSTTSTDSALSSIVQKYNK